jgi:Ca-activated chloride channel homolog
MNFAAPAFLFMAVLAVPVLVLAWRSRAPLPRLQLRLLGVLQASAIVCGAIALARPWSESSTGAVHRIVVWGGRAATTATTTIEALRAELPHHDPFTVVHAGAVPMVGLPGATVLPAAEGTPDLTAALRTAAALVPAGASAQVILFTDGEHDGEPLAACTNELAARGIPVELRELARMPREPVRLLRVEHTPRIGAGEAFRIDAWLAADQPTAARLEVRDGERLVGVADVALQPGEQHRHVDVVLQRTGPVELEVRIAREGVVDAAACRERTAVLVDAGLRVLHLTSEPSRRDAMAATLRGHGITAVAPDLSAGLDASLFATVGAVLVDDLAATAWPLAAQQRLRDQLLARGTGLVLAGTHQNLGPGGYASSPLQDILPVRMPQREERRDPSVALVLIVDTSGSMGGGRLELAKEVARLAIQKLQPHDKVGLIEFHGSKRWAAPLQPATNTIEITRALNRLQVGGGTIIYDALEESYFGLLNAQTRFQHVLVLTDGGVESGAFEALARRMAAAGQTVSSVLIGPQANSPFLLNLAQWGRGRFYSCPDKYQLPDLQFREPQSALLPAVQERRVALQRTGNAEATAAFAGDQLAASGGIVEASVRDAAEVLLRGAAGEPYLIGWDQGAGRVLVLAGQAIGPQSGELHDDPSYGAFLADLLRSAAAGASALMPQLELVTQERGVQVRLRLPAGAHLPAGPRARLVGGESVDMVFAGYRWEAFLPWNAAGAQVVEVQSGDALLANGAASWPYSRAMRNPDRTVDLQALASVTGGTQEPVGAPLPTAPVQRSPQVTPHRFAFALAALVLFFVTLLLRRLPFDRLRAPRGVAVGAGLLLVFTTMVGAQQPMPAGAADEATVRATIDAELREHGDLADLAKRWHDAPAMQRYWLARAQGDLAKAAELCAEPPLATVYRDERVRILDAIGRPAEALAALGELDPSLPPADRGAWLLRRAVLYVAAGDREAASADLQAAVAAAGQPVFAQQAGVVAAAFGFFDLALQWHQVGGEPGREACQSAFRRGLWQQRAGRLQAAAAEYETAFARATMQRDRAFALAMLVQVHRAAGSLPALADAWLARTRGVGPALHPQELGALGEILRELGRAREGLEMLGRMPPAVRRDLGELSLTLAVESGQPEVAIAQLRQELAAKPDDAATRCSLALLLADLQRSADAEQVLREGLPGARVRDLRRLCAAASELGFDAVVKTIADTFGAADGAGEQLDAFEGALLEVAHLRRQGKDDAALARLVRARDSAQRPQDRLRLAEQFESLGKLKEAIELYGKIWDETGTEDIGMRLAWLLSDSKIEAERKRAQEIFRKVWTQAGSPARRVQAEEHVLDLASREGTLADLALELEDQLAQPVRDDKPGIDRTSVRDALVKIYTRARDTTGAATILKQWAKDEPQHEVDALQQLARVYLSAEEFRNHERTLQRLLQVDPANELDYRQQLAMSALERGRPEDARRHLRDLLGKPGVPDTISLEFAAGIHTLAAQHEEAVRLYRRALALHPERVETFLLLGNALRAAGQRDAAIGTFEELLLRPLPDDLFVVAVDGLLNMDASRPVLAAAARAVRMRLAKRPGQVFLHRVLQDLLEGMQDEPGRLLALEDTLTAAGEQRANFVRELMQEAETRRDWRSYTNYGRALLLLGDEVPPAVFLSLGEALLHTGEIDAAAGAFARARLGGDFTAIETRTAELYENAGRLAEAERIRVRLLRRTPEEPSALLAVARLAERQGAAARALPNWLAAAMKLLPQELGATKVPGARSALSIANRQKAGVSFAEPLAGVLRCAASAAEIEPLLQALRLAAAKGAPDRRLAALKVMRHVAGAYSSAELVMQLRDAEDALLAGAEDAVRDEIRSRRLQAGDFAGAELVKASAEVTTEELRARLIGGDAAALAAAIGRAKPEQLPDLARALRLLGRNEEAMALLPLAEASKESGAAAARDELRTALGLPVATDTSKAEQKLQQALVRTGPLVAKVNAVFSALRELREMPDGERRAHVRSLAEAAVAQKDAAAAERVLANGRADVEGDTVTQLVELAFSNIERAYLVQQRAQYLGSVPTERAVALVRTALRKFREEERRMPLVQLFANQQVPEPVQLALVEDCDPRGIQGTERMIFVAGLDRGRSSLAVVKALAERFLAVLPDDAVTELLRARRVVDLEAQREVAKAALLRMAGRPLGERDDAIVGQLARMLSPADAHDLLTKLPERASLPFRIPLLERSGDKDATGAAMLAAHRQKPDDTGLLYRAASFFEREGRFDQAAELYRTAQKNSSQFYPYQAQQLARLELRAGNVMGALSALQAAKDPSQTNFRLVIRVLAEVPDAALRQAALAEVLQQRAARGASSGASFSFMRALGVGASGATGDRLAAVLAPVRLPPLAPQTLAEADDAPSDYDLLAFLPEGEEVARLLLRTLDESARKVDLGIYRGLLGAAKRAGHGQPLVDAAVATLNDRPFDAEALRVVFAGAQIGLVVPPWSLQRIFQEAASSGQIPASTVGSLIVLATERGDQELAERVLRGLLQQRGELADAQLRPWLPGLFAMACRQLPDLALELASTEGIDSDAAVELAAAIVLAHPDAEAAARVAGKPVPVSADRLISSEGSDLLPHVGGMLMRGDVDGAIDLLQRAQTYWLQPRMLGAQRLAAAAPPLSRWHDAGLCVKFGERLLELLATAEEERAAALARVAAVLAARMAAGGYPAAAAALRERLRGLSVEWTVADWLGAD